MTPRGRFGRSSRVSFPITHAPLAAGAMSFDLGQNSGRLTVRVRKPTLIPGPAGVQTLPPPLGFARCVLAPWLDQAQGLPSLSRRCLASPRAASNRHQAVGGGASCIRDNSCDRDASALLPTRRNAPPMIGRLLLLDRGGSNARAEDRQSLGRADSGNGRLKPGTALAPDSGDTCLEASSGHLATVQAGASLRWAYCRH